MAQGAGFRDEYDLECTIELFSEENAEGCDVARTFILIKWCPDVKCYIIDGDNISVTLALVFHFQWFI